MNINTPWGKANFIKKYQRGLTWIETPSHGGYRVSCGFAEKFLSEPARKLAMKWGNYWWYEEDCLASIIDYELITVTTQEKRDLTFKNISRWNPEYLLERGITPSPKEYSDWLVNRADQIRRSKKDPNWVISARTEVLEVGLVRVVTADGLLHNVTAESYKKARENNNYQLSDMVLI